MDKFIIKGGNSVSGSVKIDRAKNSLLPILAATVAVNAKCFIEDFPYYSDTETMLEIITKLGGKYTKKAGGVLVDTTGINSGCFPAELFCKIRASVFMLGAVISRMGKVETVFPGGCKIGARPIDIHISALEKMGVTCTVEGNKLFCTCNKLTGAKITLPFPSVGVTENILIAASVAKGETIIENAAKEPEIIDLASFLNACGAKIYGAGSDCIRIEGVKKLYGTSYLPIADRIEAGTFTIAALMLGGEIEIKGCGIQNISSIINKTGISACKIYSESAKIYIKANGQNKSIGKLRTAPFPGFPTDLQSPFVALLAVANGVSLLTDEIFPNRFGYTSQLNKMGADIRLNANTATITGVDRLHGCNVYAEDLRGGAGLTLACLKAEGSSVLYGVEHIDRGYSSFEKKLAGISLNIRRVTEEEL